VYVLHSGFYHCTLTQISANPTQQHRPHTTESLSRTQSTVTDTVPHTAVPNHCRRGGFGASHVYGQHRRE